MSVIATALKHLIAAGVSGDDLVRAVAEIEGELAAVPQAVDAAAEKRRAWDRDRKRRLREEQAASGGNPPDPVESADIADTPPSLDKSPQTPKINPTPHTRGGRAPTREAWACPEGVDPVHWRDFKTNRRSKKLATTPTAYEGQLRLIERFSSNEWPPGRLVKKAAEKGWGTIVDPSEYETPRNGQRPANDEPQSPILRACLANERDRNAFGNRAHGDEGQFRLPDHQAF